MVNDWFTRAKTVLRAIDKILDKCRNFKLSENLSIIRVEIARRSKPRLQACLVRFASKAVHKPPGDDG
jgi:hypothetical protein